MVDLWMPGAARHSIGNTGAMSGGPPRVIWHATSNANTDAFSNHVSYFTQGGAGSCPHLLWHPYSGEIAQMFPANSRSLSVRNAGSIQTNRTGQYCIQIEVCFTKGLRPGVDHISQTPCKNLGQIMDWLNSLGIPKTWPGGEPTAWARDTVSTNMWLNQGGHYGHHQVPGNDHVDPGRMPNLFSLGGSTPVAVPRYQVTINGKTYGYGAEGQHVLDVGNALVRGGFDEHYNVGPDLEWNDADTKNYSDFQLFLGYTGTQSGGAADGVPGATSLAELFARYPEPVNPPDPEPEPEPTERASHTVVSGDTLWALSQTYNVSVDDLREWNDLDDNLLEIGWELWVEDGENEPTDPDPDPDPEPVYYTVQDGDTLAGVLASQVLTVEELMDFNPEIFLQVGSDVVVGEEEEPDPDPDPFFTVGSSTPSAVPLYDEVKRVGLMPDHLPSEELYDERLEMAVSDFHDAFSMVGESGSQITPDGWEFLQDLPDGGFPVITNLSEFASDRSLPFQDVLDRLVFHSTSRTVYFPREDS